MVKKKKIQWKLRYIITHGHSEDDTFHTTSKSNLRVIFIIMKVLPRN